MGQKVTTKYKTGDIIDVICPKCGGEVDGVVNLENKPPDVVSIGYHYLDFKSEIKVKCEGTGETVRLPG